MQKHSIPALFGTVLAACVLSACSPKFNWRDYRGTDAPYTALFPAKPSTFSRPIDLNGMKITMSMTATEIDGTTFAIGSAEVPDAAMAQVALEAMKTALVKNINGTVNNEKSAAAASTNAGVAEHNASITVVASGTRSGVPVLLNGRFLAKNKHIYQVIVLGPEKNSTPESVSTFLDAVKLN